uniref:Uncharacterized protein n=1 Tax=viral metagenome TaxID=1070528 RepID=A0A6C0LVM7_9ZZZZ
MNDLERFGEHSYVPYTGKPYIYYNGVGYQFKYTNPLYNMLTEHPDRTIIRWNESDCMIKDHIPLKGMGDPRYLWPLLITNANYSANNFYK